MIPQTTGALIVFLLFVVPGITFEFLRQSSRPGLGRTTFEELTGIALWSVVFSGVAVALLGLVRAWVWPHSMPDVRLWLQDPSHYITTRYRLVARTIALEVALATVLAAFADRSLNYAQRNSVLWRIRRLGEHVLRHDPTRTVSPFPVLWTVFSLGEAGSERAASVRTRNGDVFTGKVAAYATGDSDQDRDIALRAPVEVLRARGDRTVLDEPWRVVVVPGAEITELAVTFLKPASAAQPPPERPGRPKLGHYQF